MVVEVTDILKIVKEDVLRVLGERKNSKISLESIKSEIKVSNLFISKAIEELKIKGLIEKKDHFFKLTKRGEKEGGDIFKKHLILEKYFKKIRSEKEAHKIAHILEHYISEEVIKNIKKLSTLKKRGVSLIEFRLKNGLISDIILDIGLFERIISMGIFPGEKIKIINEIPNGIVIEVKNKKFVLDKDIAKEIKVLEYEKS
jgi:Mn-dependent DtxR family transcriptional regulator